MRTAISRRGRQSWTAVSPLLGPTTVAKPWINEWGKPASQKHPIADVSAKQSMKRQLHTTYVGAVGWEPHSSSTTTCEGKVDHELPVNQSKGHTYTNPRAHALRLTHIYILHVYFHFFKSHKFNRGACVGDNCE